MIISGGASASMRSADWRRSDCRRCTRPTAGRCGCAAARKTCTAFETCHTRTAGARLASPAELHHATAAAAGTNSVDRGTVAGFGIQTVMPAFNIVVGADRLAKYRPKCRSERGIVLTLPVSNSRQPSYGGRTADTPEHECRLLQLLSKVVETVRAPL